MEITQVPCQPSPEPSISRGGHHNGAGGLEDGACRRYGYQGLPGQAPVFSTPSLRLPNDGRSLAPISPISQATKAAAAPPLRTTAGAWWPSSGRWKWTTGAFWIASPSGWATIVPAMSPRQCHVSDNRVARCSVFNIANGGRSSGRRNSPSYLVRHRNVLVGQWDFLHLARTLLFIRLLWQ